MKPSLHCLRLLFVVFGLNLLPARAADVECVLELTPFETGRYDVYGERDDGPTIGRPDGQDARGPYRDYLAFHVPQFTGTLSKAELIFNYIYVSSGDINETVRINGVTTPVALVRAGGLTLTNVYADLGDGPAFGEVDVPSVCCSVNGTTLNSDAFPAILAARGGELALGADLISLSPNAAAVEYFYLYPWSVSLRLTVTTPAPPVIHTPLTVGVQHSNYIIATVGACGAMPINYRWFSGSELIAEFDSYEARPVSANLGFGSFGTTQSVFVVMSNAFGSVTSQVVQAIAPIVYIELFETNILARVGDSFEVQAFVAPQGPPYDPVVIQWLKNGAPIPSASSTLYFDNATTNDSGLYSLFASNAFGIATSAVVNVRVLETRPVIWYQPADVTVALGDFTLFSGWAVGGPTPALQWFHNGAPLDGYTSGDVFLQPILLADAGDYYLVASNLLGSATSRVAHVSVVLDPPVFQVQPQSVTLFPNNFISLEAYATGTPAPSYQWFRNGAPVPGQNLSYFYIMGATSNSIGSYFCVASNASGVITSAVANINVLFVPPLLDGPADVIAAIDSSIYFTAIVSNPPADVTWWFNGSPVGHESIGNLPQLTYSYFGYSQAGIGQAGNYWLTASNAFGVSTSRVATLTLTSAPPSVWLLGPTQPVVEGTTVHFNAYVTGAPLPGVSLYHNGQLIPHFSNFVWHLPSATPADSGEYIALATNLVGTATATQHLVVYKAGPLDRWTHRNPLPQTKELLAVTFGQGRFVAVGRDGAIIHSTDGTNWNVRSVATVSNLFDITYADGRFVAVGENGLILTSTNGDHWVQQSLPVPSLNGVTYGAGRFVAVGQRTAYTANPALWFSTNAVDWVNASASFPLASYLRSIAFGLAGFVVVDASQGDYHSMDLTNWTGSATNLLDPENVRFVNGRYVAVGNAGSIFVSLDGVAWTKFTAGTRRLYDVAYGAGQYVIVGAKGNIRRSSDGLDWSALVTPTADRLQGITYGNGLFVAVGEKGAILTSADGAAWANQLRGSAEDLDGLDVGNGLAVTVGKNGAILTSTDGTAWTRQTAPGPQDDWHGVAYGDGLWIIVGQSTNVLVSTNGVNWEPRPVALSSIYLKSVVQAAGRWVAVGVGGIILSSTDAVTWTTRSSPVTYDLNEVTYGNGLFVIAGDHGADPQATVLTSSDGVSWWNFTFHTGKNARGISFANGVFVMPGNDGQVWFGSFPEYPAYWSVASTGIYADGANLRGGTWSNGVWVVVGNEGRLLTSTNAALWRLRLTPTLENLHAVRYINNTFIAVGNQGVILQTDPLETRFSLRREGANLRVTVSSPHESVLDLQYSADFNWTHLAYFTNTIGTVDYLMPLPPGSGQGFFRILVP